MQPALQDPPRLLRGMFDAAVAAAQPALCLPALLPSPPAGRTVVIGFGKAAAAMAQVVDGHWVGELSGVVVTRYGHGAPSGRIRVMEAAHPVPDDAGLAASAALLAAVQGLGPEDLVLCLVSGGGSALLPWPLPGLTLADEQAIARQLLASGASIAEMNCVRRHLSGIKGGRLALACRPARVVNLLLSDVPGDDPADIASGPTVPDPSDCAQALEILHRHRIAVPEAALALLRTGEAETPKPHDPRLPSIENRMAVTPQRALEAAAQVAERAGIAVHILGDAIEGESRDVAQVMAAMALQVARRDQPFVAPCVLLSGGETTVSLRGHGRGGRNVEFLLALALALQGHPRVHALAADTDGVDGIEEIAGAVIGPQTLARAHAAGLRPRERLDDNDAHTFFEALGDAVVTGPTRTNVNDFRAVLVLPPHGESNDAARPHARP
ncbi:glycerate 2-kinase [Pseudacidovorax intermedius]|uniref:Glycerate 2-kinase n=1 Tax=Pseudacidovorax intermedius TaxID=433924 RepID=A0A370FHE9_9BURK|nr:glycerate kinase [Pseudacidovorax intermedius]RDI26170.1 glycerate 2-kinase [Pseudacidovorax intermedius]